MNNNKKIKKNRIKGKNHTIISIDEEKAFDKTQQPFMIKTCIELGMRKNFLRLLRHLHSTAS